MNEIIVSVSGISCRNGRRRTKYQDYIYEEDEEP